MNVWNHVTKQRVFRRWWNINIRTVRQRRCNDYDTNTCTSTPLVITCDNMQVGVWSKDYGMCWERNKWADNHRELDCVNMWFIYQFHCVLCLREHCRSLWMIYSPPSSAPVALYLWLLNTFSTCWMSRLCSTTSLTLRPSTSGRPTGNWPSAAAAAHKWFRCEKTGMEARNGSRANFWWAAMWEEM